jgi:hypothetical protein
VSFLAVPSPLPHGIALAGRLELYYLGAEVGQELAAERTGE